MPQPSSLHRRQFLIGSSAAGAAISLGGLFPVEALAQTGDRAWRDLAKRMSGPVLRPGNFDFGKFATPYNLRYAATRPSGIALCATPQDVAEAIGWCREHDMPLVARSGGHSYAGYSTTRGLMIDVSLMRFAQIDAATGIVRIGGGARNQDLYDVLRRTNTAITHGRCPRVGAAGFLLGGGIGFNMRVHGVACDQVIGSEMVTAEGKVLSLGPAENEPLYWACRGGGGGNFGVNTSFTLQTFPAPAMITVFNLTWRSATPEKLFGALMHALDQAPEGFGSRVSLAAVTPRQRAAGQDVAIHLLGQLTGNRGQLADILAPAYALAPPTVERIEQTSYWDGQDSLKESDDPPGFFQERSSFLTRNLDDTAIARAFEWLRRWPGTRATADLRFFQTGGRMNRVAAEATAFVHRDSRWIMDIGLNWTAADLPERVRLNRVWQDQFFDVMRPASNGAAYQNFIDPSLKDWASAYYGINLPRLARIKADVDPANVFRSDQSIRPSSG